MSREQQRIKDSCWIADAEGKDDPGGCPVAIISLAAAETNERALRDAPAGRKNLWPVGNNNTL